MKNKVDTFIQGKDNWGFIVSNTNEAIIIDPLDAEKNLGRLKDKKLVGILLTHYHNDHTAGVEGILSKHSVPVWGPAQNSQAPAFVSNKIREDGSFSVGSFNFKSTLLPGHSLELASYFIDRKVFVGDLLFNLGCGRVVDGDHQTLFDSLQKLKSFPVDLEIFVGHDYREKNLGFAQHLDPSYYSALSLDDLEPTSSLEMELWWNPFLRVETFSDWKQLRDLRDNF